MPRLIEHARRHGPFDPRFRARPSQSLPGFELPLTPSDIAGWENEGRALRAPLARRLPPAGAMAAAGARPKHRRPHGPAHESGDGRRRTRWR